MRRMSAYYESAEYMYIAMRGDKMTLKNKATHRIIVSTFILILILYGISNRVIFEKFIVLEDKIVNENVNRVVYALDREIININAFASDWGAWDETYEFVENLNEDYAESNLVDDLFINYKVNFIIFINNKGEIVYSKYFDLIKEEQVSSNKELEKYLSKIGEITHSSTTSDKKSGVIMFRDNPILISSVPIITSSFTGPINGQLIVGKYFNEQTAVSISKATSLNITFSLFDSPNIADDFKEAKLFLANNKGNFVNKLNENSVAGYSLVKDIKGEPAFILKIDMNRDIYKESNIAKIYFLVLLFLVLIVITCIDITTGKRMEEKFNRIAYFDQLTNLPNRVYFIRKIEDFIADAKENFTGVALLYLDFNRFKLINDIEGHDAGDTFLKDVGEKMLSFLNDDMVIGRLGEDEFGILLPNIKEEEEVIEICNKILEAVNQAWIFNAQVFHITASVGIAIYPKHGEDAVQLLKNADAAMYHAKERGKSNYEFYHSSLSSSALKQVSMENSLLSALDKDEFILHYQPQVNISTGKIIGVEALIRWNNPDHGIVCPQKFIPFAEENGLITSIDKWVFRTACIQSKYWQNLNVKPIRIAVNVSSKQLEEAKFVQYVRDLLNEIKVDPSWLEIEITEGALMKQPEEVVKILSDLKNMGIKIALDDFGIGYSSLAYLKKFPIDKLKIDKSFINDITQNVAIVKTIIDLSKNMGLTVIAEGVETEEQLEILKEQQCDEVQGYLFGKPVGIREIEEKLLSDF